MPTSQDTAGGRVADAFIATLLAIGSVVVIVATNDMGFVRDEAFYFAHAEGYQDWFVRLEGTATERAEALERKEILATWQQNAEHPPLDKILFGWSWRALGQKLRPAVGFREADDGRVLADVSQLGPAHGFAGGALVTLLKPQRVGQPAAADGRAMLAGEVIERLPGRAVVRLEMGADLEFARERCPAAGPGQTTVPDPDPGADGVPGVAAAADVRRTSCEFVEERFSYFLSESDALRFPGALFAGLLIAGIYLAARLWFAARITAASPGLLTRPFALLAALGYLCIPQPFWHAHLCTFDTTITALLLLTTFAFHRSLRSRPWVWITSVLWGFSLLAKHNALFLPVPLALHWLWDAFAERRIQMFWAEPPGKPWILFSIALFVAALAGVLVHPLAGLALGLLVVAGPAAGTGMSIFGWRGLGGLSLRLPPVPTAFFAMLPIGLAILVAGWPLLWTDPADHFLRWIEFHLHHEHYMQTWFGQVLAYPPFPPWFSWGMTALTWPLTLLVAVVLGLVAVYLPPRLTERIAAALGRARAGLPGAAPYLPPPPPRPPSGFLTPWARMESTDARGHPAELRSHDRLVLLSALWPMALISLPGTPVFGGTKHWMVAFPFLLLIGARGVQAVWWHLAASLVPPPPEEPRAFRPGSTEEQLARSGHLAGPLPAAPGVFRSIILPAALAWSLVLALLLPAAQATADAHPHGSAYYNDLIGGIPGAAEAGMQRQFWGGATRDGLEEVNGRAPANASVWFHKSAWGAYAMYGREGWFRHDLRYSGDPAGTSHGFYHHQKDHDDYELDLMRDYGWRIPAFQSAVDGVPMLSVYERPGAPRQPPTRR